MRKVHQYFICKFYFILFVFKGQNYIEKNADRRESYSERNVDNSSPKRNSGHDFENDYEMQTHLDYEEIANSHGFNPYKYTDDSIGENIDYNYFSDY